MDGFEEKKWFVYIGDHHEGPFSLAEIQQKMSQGLVSSSTYVWADGMGDWKPMTEVAAFESLLRPVEVNPPSPPADLVPPPGPSLQLVDSNDTSAPEPVATVIEAAVPAVAPEQPEEKTGEMDVSEQRKLGQIAAHRDDQGKASKGNRKRIIFWSVLLVLVIGFAVATMRGALDPVFQSPGLKAGAQAVSDFSRPHLIKLVEKFPKLGRWISPIPSLDDVTGDDYEDLKTAAMIRVDAEGPRVGVALSRSDLFAPVFYIASNLPDGAQFDIFVEGVSDTLLNYTSFSSRLVATVSRKFGKTAVLRFGDGKPLPRGEYNIYVIESEQQPNDVRAILQAAQPSGIKLPSNLPKGSRVIAKKNYFLGGIKDATYLARLKEYHDKLTQRATAELSELKQFAATLDSQLGSSIANFSRLRRGAKPSRSSQTTWGTFHGKWMQLDTQLNETFRKWTPDVLQAEYFYGGLYQLVQQTAQAVEQVHSVQQSYFVGNVEKTSFDIQVGQVVSAAQTAISTLKAKIDAVEKLPPTTNGMPRREAL